MSISTKTYFTISFYFSLLGICIKVIKLRPSIGEFTNNCQLKILNNIHPLHFFLRLSDSGNSTFEFYEIHCNYIYIWFLQLLRKGLTRSTNFILLIWFYKFYLIDMICRTFLVDFILQSTTARKNNRINRETKFVWWFRMVEFRKICYLCTSKLSVSRNWLTSSQIGHKSGGSQTLG